MKEQVIIDVREQDEYDSGHVENSVNVPLSRFAAMAPGVLYQLRDKAVVLMCYSGKRAANAYSLAQGFGYSQAVNYEIYEGGIKAWSGEGKPLVQTKKAQLSLLRQTQLVMGGLVAVFSVMGAALNPDYAILAAGVGAGMIVAGLTGNCVMANAVSRMPWNRA